MKNLLFISLMFCSLSMLAQNERNSIERKGFVFGIGAGAGVISIADSGDEASFDEAQFGISLPNLKIGWMLDEKLAVLATIPGMIYEYEGKDRSFEALIPTVQYWATNRWWISSGAGLAVDFPAFYEVDDIKNEDWNFGGAVSAATGFELVQKKKYALDFQTKVHLGRVYLDNDQHRDAVALSIGLGFNWY